MLCEHGYYPSECMPCLHGSIKEMVEAYGEMEKGIEDPILCHYNGLRLHNAMEDLRALVIPGYKLNYEPNLDPEPDGSPEENLNPGLK